jgi:hypothetical protein
MVSAPVLCLARSSIASRRLRLTVASRSSDSSWIERSFTAPICFFRPSKFLAIASYRALAVRASRARPSTIFETSALTRLWMLAVSARELTKLGWRAP